MMTVAIGMTTDFYTIPQAALVLGVGQPKVYQLIYSGLIKGHKIRPKGSGFAFWQLPAQQAIFSEGRKLGRPNQRGPQKPTTYQDRLDCFGELAYAILKRAIDDIKDNEQPLNALVFLYGYGAELAEMLGIDRQAWDAQVYAVSRKNRGFVESVSRIPADLAYQPLFHYDELCDLCGWQPHNSWYAQFIHWRSKHPEELKKYLTDLFGWLGSDGWRVQLVGLRTGLEAEDLEKWLDRARLFVRNPEARIVVSDFETEETPAD